MGIRSGIFVFLRPPYYGGIRRTGRPGTREKEIGFESSREIPHEKNPLGVFQIGELYLVENRRGERRMDGREVGWRSEVVEI